MSQRWPATAHAQPPLDAVSEHWAWRMADKFSVPAEARSVGRAFDVSSSVDYLFSILYLSVFFNTLWLSTALKITSFSTLFLCAARVRTPTVILGVPILHVQWRNYIEANEAAASVEIRLVGAWLDVA